MQICSLKLSGEGAASPIGATMRKAARSIPQTDRERRKRLWLDPVMADINTLDALETAAGCHVSLRLVAQVVGLIVNLNSFLDAGYVYASQEGLARYIKNENGRPSSARQVRRVIRFLVERGHLRVDGSPGISNLMYPLYRATVTNNIVSSVQPARTEDIMAGNRGHDVRGVGTSWPPKPVYKPSIQTYRAETSTLRERGTVVKLGERATSSSNCGSEDASKKPPIEGKEIVQHRLAERLGYGDVKQGFVIILSLSDSDVDQLTAMERTGKLSEAEIEKARAAADLRR
jgi:hypothetical protein